MKSEEKELEEKGDLESEETADSEPEENTAFFFNGVYLEGEDFVEWLRQEWDVPSLETSDPDVGIRVPPPWLLGPRAEPN